MKKEITVLSLFDGCSCGQLALQRANIPVKQYYASEIDKYAISITQKNFPETIQLGDVQEIDVSKLPKIDLLIGGSPCQGFSYAGKQLNFNDPRSALFFEFVRILEELKQKNPNIKFLLENVVMKKEYVKIISEQLNIFPVKINSSLVSAQIRKRLYWSNIKVREQGLFSELWTDIPQPKDKKIFLKDIILPENQVDRKFYLSKKMHSYFFPRKSNFNNGKINVRSLNGKATTLTSSYSSPDISDNFINTAKNFIQFDVSGQKYNSQQDRLFFEHSKMQALSANRGDSKTKIITNKYKLRRLTPVECERLQTVTDNYTQGVSNSQRYKMLGNGWTVDVIAHIFNFINN